MSTELTIGMKLFGIKRSWGQKGKLSEFTISKIGRKYFYTTEDSDVSFDKETLLYSCKDYSQNNVQLYLTKQEILDMYNRSDLHQKIRNHFSSQYQPQNTLEELSRIAEILGITPSNHE
jgi:hypothetical protein